MNRTKLLEMRLKSNMQSLWNCVDQESTATSWCENDMDNEIESIDTALMLMLQTAEQITTLYDYGKNARHSYPVEHFHL